MPSKLSAALIACAMTLPTTAVSEPAFGVGISYVFGGDVAVGIRVFSTDRPESAAASIGLDFKFDSESFRPTIGAAYLDEKFFIDFSLGIDTKSGDIDYSIGAGGLTNMRAAAPATLPTIPTGPTDARIFRPMSF